MKLANLIPVALLLLATVHANKCNQDCAQFKLDTPTKPEAGMKDEHMVCLSASTKTNTGTNTGLAVSKVVESMFKFMGTKGFPDSVNEFGKIGGAMFSGIWGAATAQDTSDFQRYKMEMAFKQQQDYLSCVMEAQVSNAAYQINQRMDDDKIEGFNQAIAAVLLDLRDNCGAHNCLNASRVEPGKRNDMMNAACVQQMTPTVDKLCDPRIKTVEDRSWREGRWIVHYRNITIGWDPEDIVLCQSKNQAGDLYDGVCGGDGFCYHANTGFKGTIELFKKIKDEFLKKDSINLFHAFDNLYNPSAVVAYAKGAVVYLGLLQELFFLGDTSAQDNAINKFAAMAADWLQDRVNYHSNVNVSLSTVMDASSLGSEPMRVRSSCKDSDLYEQWWGCASIGIGVNPDTNMCLLPPGSSGNAEKLCACECGRCRGTDGYLQQRPMAVMKDAAKKLSEQNMKLFEQSGVLSTIATFRKMSQLNPTMPPGTFNMYRAKFTPRWACTLPRTQGMLQAARGSKPAWEREDKLNIDSAPLPHGT